MATSSLLEVRQAERREARQSRSLQRNRALEGPVAPHAYVLGPFRVPGPGLPAALDMEEAWARYVPRLRRSLREPRARYVPWVDRSPLVPFRTPFSGFSGLFRLFPAFP